MGRVVSIHFQQCFYQEDFTWFLLDAVSIDGLIKYTGNYYQFSFFAKKHVLHLQDG